MCTHTRVAPPGSGSTLRPSSISVVEASSMVKTVWEVKSTRAAASGSGGGDASSSEASACPRGHRGGGLGVGVQQSERAASAGRLVS